MGLTDGLNTLKRMKRSPTGRLENEIDSTANQ